MMLHRIPGSVNYHKVIIYIGAVLGICWVTVIGGFLWWETNALHKSSIDLAAVEARASFNKDLVYRRWAANHGGTYVPVAAGTPPNPYLSHIPERDITTPRGKALTQQTVSGWARPKTIPPASGWPPHTAGRQKSF